jgi:hypothetical protein
MNALPNAWMLADPPSSTTVQEPVLNIVIVNKLMDAISDAGMYESEDEPKPQSSVIQEAAKMLCEVSVENAEIAPCYGEINVTWRADSKRVKATFGPDPAIFYVYKENIERGHVNYSHMEEHADRNYLRDSLAWLANPRLNVR